MMNVVVTLIGLALIAIGLAVALPALPSYIAVWLIVAFLVIVSLGALGLALRPRADTENQG